MPRQQGNLRLTHLQCSQFAWSRNQGRVTSIHAADSVTFAERVQEIPSPDHRTKYTGVVNTVLRYSNVLHLHQHVCHEIGDTMVRTSRFAIQTLLPTPATKVATLMMSKEFPWWLQVDLVCLVNVKACVRHVRSKRYMSSFQRSVVDLLVVECPDESANKSSMNCSFLNSLATNLSRTFPPTLC